VRKLATTLGFVLVGLVASAGWADSLGTVDVAFDNPQFYGTAEIQANRPDLGINNLDENVYTCPYQVTLTNPSNATVAQITAMHQPLSVFCVDIRSGVRTTDTTYTVQNLSDPINLGGGYLLSLSSGQLNLLKALFSTHYADGTSSQSGGNAFSLAVWKIVYDTGDNVSSYGMDAGAEGFKSPSSDAANASRFIVNAENLVTSLHNDTSSLPSPYILSNPTYQDFAFTYAGTLSEPVPEPTGLVGLASLGLCVPLASVYALRGRLRRRWWTRKATEAAI
jgi:hypothetical protein